MSPYAQQGAVRYKQITHLSHSPDTSVALLHFKEQQSSYVFGVNNSKSTNVDQQVPDAQIFFVRDSKGLIYFADYHRQAFLNREFLLNKPVVVRDEFSTMDWDINYDSLKNISGHKCIKATIQFRGRNYTAWFDPQIPVPFGPWKLRGLPGLIIEAYEDDGIIKFLFEKYSSGPAELIFPKEKLSMNQEQYVKNFKKKLSSLEKFMTSHSSIPRNFKVQSKSKIHVLERSLYED